MKKLNEYYSVDVQQELSDMIDYTLKIWDGDKNDLTEIITQAFNVGYSSAENLINNYKISSFFLQWIENRKKCDNIISPTDMSSYDDILTFATNFTINSFNITEITLKDWSYDKQTRSLTYSIQSQLNNPKILPKGWEEAQKSNKSANELFDCFNVKEYKLFKGYNSESPGFHELINLPNTFYSDTEQGRTPLYTLVSSAFSHGLNIRAHNNTFHLLEEARKIQQHFNEEEFNKPVFIKDPTSLSDNPIFKALSLDRYNMNEEREYHSQQELDDYLKIKKEQKEISTTSYPIEKPVINKLSKEERDNIYNEKIISILGIKEKTKNKIK